MLYIHILSIDRKALARHFFEMQICKHSSECNRTNEHLCLLLATEMLYYIFLQGCYTQTWLHLFCPIFHFKSGMSINC